VDEVEIVFFDAGGTLLRPAEDVGEVYARTAGRYGLAVEAPAVVEAFLTAFRDGKRAGHPQTRAWWSEVVRATFAPFGRPTDPQALFDDLYAHFTAPGSWRLFDGARETVEELRARGYRTGLISNWDDRLPSLLDGLGLTPLLDPIVVSCRVGAEKPHRRIFESALAEAAVAPGRALMVGDDWEADVEGAEAVGMRALHVRRPGQTAGNGHGVDCLTELLRLLPGNGHRRQARNDGSPRETR